jgi:hypothetical protein
MAKRKRPPLPATGPDVSVDSLPAHEGAEPDHRDVDAHRRWRHVRAARLRRESDARTGGDPRVLLMPWLKIDYPIKAGK